MTGTTAIKHINNSNGVKYRTIVCLFYFLITSFIGLVIASTAMMILMSDGQTTPMLRISTVVQDVMLFITPAVVTAIIVSTQPASLLGINTRIDTKLLLLAVVTFLFAMPALDAVVRLNNQMSLPASLSGVEEWMRTMEQSARQQVELLLGPHTAGDLIVDLLIVGFLAGLSEELFFRGALQRLLTATGINPHIAIWTVALIFSAFHMQFFGFFPRMLLGAFFGYLFWWSGSLWVAISIHVLNNCIVVVDTWSSDGYSPSADASSDISGTVPDIALAVGSIVITLLLIIRLKRLAVNHSVKC